MRDDGFDKQFDVNRPARPGELQFFQRLHVLLILLRLSIGAGGIVFIFTAPTFNWIQGLMVVGILISVQQATLELTHHIAMHIWLRKFPIQHSDSDK